MGTKVDVVLVEDQGMYMIGETWMLPVESIGVCTDEYGRGCSVILLNIQDGYNGECSLE